jgi:hypothetical protein
MDSRSVTNIVCVFCGKKEYGYGKQLKLLAKKLGWKHEKGKGSWVCPECYTTLTPLYELERSLARRGYEDG